MCADDIVEPGIAAEYEPATELSPTEPDWNRERRRLGEFDPGKSLVYSVRQHQKWRGRWGPIGRVLSAWYMLKNRFWSALCGCRLPVSAKLGGGLVMPHPQGIVLHGDVRIGPNCLIFHQVTLGEGGPIPGVPTLGGHVDVGAGAKILGGVTIGDHARIGANAVVITDVPAMATAVGVPARIIARGRNDQT